MSVLHVLGMAPADIPLGLCQCGCGTKTAISPVTYAKRGLVKGQPRRFVTGHNSYLRRRGYKIEDRGYTTPCWVWQGVTSGGGYCQINLEGRLQYVHRAVYERLVGPVPEGHQLDHLCRVQTCMNPEHLEVVTPAENTRRQPNLKLSTDIAEALRTELAAVFAASPLNRRGEPRRYPPDGTTRKLAEKYSIPQERVMAVWRGRAWRP